jgi:hypothetical protein
MAQITKRGIENNAVDGEKLRLNNNQSLRSRNATNNGDVEILKVNSQNDVELLNLPKFNESNVATETYVNGITDTLIPISEKGASLGVATLDAGGKIPASQLPSTVVEYLGTWDAATNTPQLQDGIGDAGDVYIVSLGGVVDFGNGPIEFSPGDWVIFNGSEWEKSINSNAVQSVNGFQGVVELTTDNIEQGSANLYYSQSLFDSSLSNKTTDDLAEGVTNQYYTDQKAKDAVVVDNLNGNETDKAPSVSSVKQYVSDNATRVEVETFALSGTDISNGYLDLAEEAQNVIEVTPKGFPVQHPFDDYSLSVVSGKTRVTFLGDMLLLGVGDKIKIAYSV